METERCISARQTREPSFICDEHRPPTLAKVRVGNSAPETALRPRSGTARPPVVPPTVQKPPQPVATNGNCHWAQCPGQPLFRQFTLRLKLPVSLSLQGRGHQLEAPAPPFRGKGLSRDGGWRQRAAALGLINQRPVQKASAGPSSTSS